jgi:negative regulator of sigma E activity
MYVDKIKKLKSILNMQQKYSLVTDNQFAITIVSAITGVSLEFYAPEKQEQLLQQCFDIFQNYMVSYFQENYSEVDTLRLKAGQLDDKVYDKFPDLSPKFDKAVLAFSKDILKQIKQ